MSLYEVFADWAKRKGLDASISRFQGTVDPATVEAWRTQYLADVSKIQTGGPPIIAASNELWYSGPGEDDDFWPALEESFRSQGWSTDRMQSVDDASSIVVAHTPQPSRPKWDSKGLVVGYVQSGKTTNFTAVIAKMADVEYDFIIVLSGIHNGLRRQTQVRLNETFKGDDATQWVFLTNEETDFRSPPFTLSSVLAGKRVLAVAKKNAAVLGRLIKWLERPDSRRALQTARVLIIDDEADQASVATRRINPQIRQLLSLPHRRTYIGYTATPFANVFIDPSQDDLYPKSFILNLPRPDGYFGPEKIFGRDVVEGEDDDPAPDGYDMIRDIPEDDLHLYRPAAKQAAADFSPEMTDELQSAVRWFWLATAARRARGDDEHSTMLIHTSVKIDVHESYKDPLDDLRDAALTGIFESAEDARSMWESIWAQESSRVPSEDFGRTQNTFDEVWQHLPDVIERSRVILDNYRSDYRLDYEGPEPVVAIAVGGNTLSRGLTLEGLVVSLFVRGATAYDTLLQMGRWFGYRIGYEDLPRIWMTPSLQSQFRHLAAVEHDMRADIDRYQHENLKPSEVAVRVRTHPSLRITAKMGGAQPAYVSYAGRRLQTRYFLTHDQEWLEQNLDAASELVQEAGAAGRRDEQADKILFHDVPEGLVRAFLQAYQVHADSPDLDRTMVLRYLDSQIAEKSLLFWSVAVVAGTPSDEVEKIRLGGLEVPGVVRSRLNNHDPLRADIKTLMSKQDRALDLALTVKEARAAQETKLIELRNADPLHRDKGLLVLYPIDRTSPPAKIRNALHPERAALDALAPVIGMGLVFPGDAQKRNRVAAEFMAVDLSDVEVEDLEDALEGDTEDGA